MYNRLIVPTTPFFVVDPMLMLYHTGLSTERKLFSAIVCPAIFDPIWVAPAIGGVLLVDDILLVR